MLKRLIIVLLLMAFITTPIYASTTSERINDSIRILKEIAQQPDSRSMVHFLGNAKGVAIFPSVMRAGLMVGGRFGEGIVLQRDGETGEWYGPYFVQMRGLSYGLQIGVQSTALVLVITNERGMDSFREGKFTLGGSLSVAAGPVGRWAEAGTDINLKASIYSYSMSRGAFAGMSVEGSSIDSDSSANAAYWNSPLSASQMLTQKADDPRIQPLIEELNKLIASANN